MSILRPALTLLLGLVVLTGVLYPLAVTGSCALLFPEKAQGSIVYRGSTPIGSSLVGQEFKGERWFWGRPSSTSAHPYDAAAAAGSNLGPTNPVLIQAVRERVDRLQAGGGVPVDLVTSSASGLDPDISTAAALFQVERVALARGLDASTLRALVESLAVPPSAGLLGMHRVNVLRLNLALDALAGGSP